MINRRQAIKTLVAAPIIALPLSSSEAKADTEADAVNNGVPVIKFSTSIHISNLEEIFKDVPWIADKFGPQPNQIYVFKQKTMAWLPKDKAVMPMPKNMEELFIGFYGLVSLVRYKYCNKRELSRVIIAKTAKSTGIDMPSVLSIPSNISIF